MKEPILHLKNKNKQKQVILSALHPLALLFHAASAHFTGTPVYISAFKNQFNKQIPLFIMYNFLSKILNKIMKHIYETNFNDLFLSFVLFLLLFFFSPHKGPEKPKADSIKAYRLTKRPCGVCLIINNVDFRKTQELDVTLGNRHGSDIDASKIIR